ncbi:MAG: hypothetical protein ACREX0_01950, partial [Noviherbaspirillum sp.]
GVAPALSQRLSEVIFTLKGKHLSVVISQSDLNHSRNVFEREYVIERGANVGVKYQGIARVQGLKSKRDQ